MENVGLDVSTIESMPTQQAVAIHNTSVANLFQCGEIEKTKHFQWLKSYQVHDYCTTTQSFMFRPKGASIVEGNMFYTSIVVIHSL